MTLEELLAMKDEVSRNASLTAEEKKTQLRRLRKKIRELRPASEDSDDSQDMASEGSEKAAKAPRAPRQSSYMVPTLIPLADFIVELESQGIELKQKDFCYDKYVHGFVVFPGTTPAMTISKFKERWPGTVPTFFAILQQSEGNYTLGIGPVPVQVAVGAH